MNDFHVGTLNRSISFWGYKRALGKICLTAQDPYEVNACRTCEPESAVVACSGDEKPNQGFFVLIKAYMGPVILRPAGMVYCICCTMVKVL